MRSSMRLSAGTSALRCCHPALLLDGATGGVHGAGELDQNSVAGAFNNAASVSRDRRFQKFTPVRVEPGERALLISAH